MKKTIPKIIGFLLFSILLFAIVGIRTIPQNDVDVIAQSGYIDAHKNDFTKSMLQIPPDHWMHYPNQLLSSSQEGITGMEPSSFGTLRLQLHLPAGKIYAICQTTASYALRVMVNGQDIGALGKVGNTPGESQEQGGTLLTSFYAPQPEVEIAIQYSGFVRQGKLPTFQIGSVEMLSLQRQRLIFRDVLFIGSLLTAAMLFFGTFLFFGKKNQAFYLTLWCLSLALYRLVTDNLCLTLLWPVSALSIARIEYISMLGASSAFFLYLRTLLPECFPRVWVRLTLCATALFMGCFLFLLPHTFPWLRLTILIIMGSMALYLGFRLLSRIRLMHTEQIFIIFAAMLMILITVAEQILIHNSSPYWNGGDVLGATLMIAVIFLNVVALSVYMMQTELKLSESLQMEKALIQTNEALDQINTLQQEFLLTASHELCTPLSIISGHAQLSVNKLKLGKYTEKIPHHLDVIIRESTRLSRLVTELLSREPSYGVPSELVCDISVIAKQCMDLFLPLLEKKGNRLLLSLSDSLPNVAMDSASATQILLNLLTNANRHTANGTIEIGATVEKDRVSIWVSDTGEGIAPYLLPYVFERRIRGKNSFSGGLGLAICRKRVEACCGEITINSEEGKGTTVQLRLLPAAPTRNGGK